MSPKCRLKVTFFGEAGINTGALSREFLKEMVAEVKNRLFVGGSDKKGKNPVYCLNGLDSNYFRSMGEIMAACLVQGGPCPNFMSEWCYRHLCSSDSDSIQINRIRNNISDLIDDVVTCGYTGIMSMENRDSIIRTVVLHSTMRVIPMLDQLRKGLQLYDLPNIMKTHQDLCLPLFVPGKDDEVNVTFLLERSSPVFSEISSAKHQKEVKIIIFLQDYL